MTSRVVRRNLELTRILSHTSYSTLVHDSSYVVDAVVLGVVVFVDVVVMGDVVVLGVVVGVFFTC